MTPKAPPQGRRPLCTSSQPIEGLPNPEGASGPRSSDPPEGIGALRRTNEKIRRDVLNWLYQRNSVAMSQYGKHGSAVKISDVKKGLKNEHGLRQQQVMSNLTYLIDKGWINKTQIKKTVQVKGETVTSTVTWYEISATGIDKIEGESEFKEGGKYAGININATGTTVITLGDGNVVNAKFADLNNRLSELKTAIAASSLQ